MHHNHETGNTDSTKLGIHQFRRVVNLILKPLINCMDFCGKERKYCCILLYIRNFFRRAKRSSRAREKQCNMNCYNNRYATQISKLIRMVCISRISTNVPIARLSLSVRSIFEERKKTRTSGTHAREETSSKSTTSPNSSSESSDKISRADRLSSSIKTEVVIEIANPAVDDPVSDGLINLLRVSRRQAKVLLRKYPHFQSQQTHSLSSTLNSLLGKNIPLKRILLNPWLLLMENDVLEQKVKEVMKKLKIKDFETALPFVGLKPSKLNDIAVLWEKERRQEPALQELNIRSRLEYLSINLECPTTEVADMMAKVEALKTMRFSSMQAILTTLVDGGVRKVDIRTDPWIFEHNIERMKERLTKSQTRGLSKIKPWILRSPPTKFESHVSRMIQEQTLLKGHKDVGSFLQQKLNCSKLTAREILTRVPSIKTASAMKLDEMIQFLYSQGFTADHIVETPRILGHSVETIASRTKELSTYDYQPNSLLVLCKTCKNYSIFIRRLSPKKSSNKLQVNEK